MTVSLLSKVTSPFSVNSLFILSMRVIARSILGPVTMHICVPCRLLFLRQSQAIYRSINSVIPRPVAFFIQICKRNLDCRRIYVFPGDSVQTPNDILKVKLTLRNFVITETPCLSSFIDPMPNSSLRRSS
jgi:hypothetical protein